VTSREQVTKKIKKKNAKMEFSEIIKINKKKTEETTPPHTYYIKM
jgi:hypothetical protein